MVEKICSTVKKELQRSNPFGQEHCRRNDCVTCNLGSRSTAENKDQCTRYFVTTAKKRWEHQRRNTEDWRVGRCTTGWKNITPKWKTRTKTRSYKTLAGIPRGRIKGYQVTGSMLRKGVCSSGSVGIPQCTVHCNYSLHQGTKCKMKIEIKKILDVKTSREISKFREFLHIAFFPERLGCSNSPKILIVSGFFRRIYMYFHRTRSEIKTAVVYNAVVLEIFYSCLRHSKPQIPRNL